MDTTGLLIFVLVILIGIAALTLSVINHYLKKIFKPNEKYLQEIKEIKIIKILPIINLILVFMVIVVQSSNTILNKSKDITLLIILILLLEGISNKCVLSYLKFKDDSRHTKKYIIFSVLLKIVLVVISVLCFLFFIK